MPGVRETAAVAVPPIGGGPDRLIVRVVPGEGCEESAETWQTRFQMTIRERLNPLFRVSDVVITQSLPRTASNKVMRRKLRGVYKSKEEEL